MSQIIRNDAEIDKYFNDELRKTENNCAAVASIMTMIKFFNNKATTFQELTEQMKYVTSVVKKTQPSLSVETVAEIFIRYTTLKCSHIENFIDAKAELQVRGEEFLKYVKNCTSKVARISEQFVSDGCTVMVHSVSRAVFQTLLAAKRANKRFKVFITRSSPDNSGEKMYNWLKDEGIPCTLILDAAIGYYMERVDLALVGAVALTHNGGILNKVGTYPMALAAKAANKPFYTVVESYKFSRKHPLNQKDAFVGFNPKHVHGIADSEEWSRLDYTDPRYISLLLTDLGPIATAAVSDVLMQLYL